MGTSPDGLDVEWAEAGGGAPGAGGAHGPISDVRSVGEALDSCIQAAALAARRGVAMELDDLLRIAFAEFDHLTRQASFSWVSYGEVTAMNLLAEAVRRFHDDANHTRWRGAAPDRPRTRGTKRGARASHS